MSKVFFLYLGSGMLVAIQNLPFFFFIRKILFCCCKAYIRLKL